MYCGETRKDISMTTQDFKAIVLDLLGQGRLDEESFWQGMSETERDAHGTWERWSAKDHIAHRTFWRQELIQKLTALLQHEDIPSSDEDEEYLNATTYGKQQQRSASEIQADSDRTYAELIALTEQLSEDDLTSTRFPGISGKHPLYTALLGALYEHEQEHLAQYYVDHDDLPKAIEVRERCAHRILQAQVPQWVKGSFLYNLASFYTQQNQLEKAHSVLQEALTSAPELEERSKSDPDLAALRGK
jgi:tetratricopeptide (TPR) repeat protein